jgi:hypothetical protein
MVLDCMDQMAELCLVAETEGVESENGLAEEIAERANTWLFALLEEGTRRSRK